MCIRDSAGTAHAEEQPAVSAGPAVTGVSRESADAAGPAGAEQQPAIAAGPAGPTTVS